MKLHSNGDGFTLESADEVAGFKRISVLASELRQSQQERAQRVFDTFLSGSELVPLRDVLLETNSSSVSSWMARMNTAIDADLDHRSIAHFVDLIVAWSDRAGQTAKALKRHAENHAMKDEVFCWLDENMRNFRSMDKAAEAIAGKVVPIAVRTARRWVGEWKNVRSTGTA